MQGHTVLMQIRLTALPLALLYLGACTAPFVVPSSSTGAPPPAPAIPSSSLPVGSAVPVAPHAEDPSIGPDPTVIPVPEQSDPRPIAPDVELASPGPDPTVPTGDGLDEARYR